MWASFSSSSVTTAESRIEAKLWTKFKFGQVKLGRGVPTLPQSKHPLLSPLSSSYPNYPLWPRTTSVKPPSTHLALYPEGPHPMLTIFEEVEKGHLAQNSTLLNSSKMKPIPLHKLLGYKTVLLPLLLIMSLHVPSLILLGQDITLNTHIVNHWHIPYLELIGKRKHLMTLSCDWTRTKRGYRLPSGDPKTTAKRERVNNRYVMRGSIWRVKGIFKYIAPLIIVSKIRDP